MEEPRDRLAELVLALSLVGYPLAASVVELTGVSSRTVTVPFRAFVLALSLYVIVRAIWQRQQLIPRSFWIIWWSFWALYLARMLIDQMYNPVALKLPLSDYLFYAIGTCIVPAVAVAFARGSAATRAALDLMLALACAGIVITLLIIVHQKALTSFEQISGVRLDTGTFNPISLANLGANGVLLATWAFLRTPARTRTYTTWLAAAWTLSMVAVVSGASRGPTIALAAALATFFVTGNLRFFRARRRIVLFGTILFAGFYVVVTQLFSLNRVESDILRLRLLQEGASIVLSNPFFGGGVEPLEMYPHNLILESFMAYGVFTGVLFVILLAMASIPAVKLLVRRDPTSWVALVFVQYAVGAMLSGNIASSAPFWVFLAAMPAIASAARLPSEPGARFRTTPFGGGSNNAVQRRVRAAG